MGLLPLCCSAHGLIQLLIKAILLMHGWTHPSLAVFGHAFYSQSQTVTVVVDMLRALENRLL